MSKYPNQLDDDVDLPSISDNITEIGAEAINALRSSVFAIQAALGEDPQGAAADLKTRLAIFFNEDGTPKATALIAAGLVSLPISNDQIAANAAIQESKLDLDITTQTLQDEISSNDVDIAQLQNLYNNLIFDITQHFLGNANRHDGYDIDFNGLPAVSNTGTVSLAIHTIWERFLAHKGATSGIEHYASAISYTPSYNGPITATNVQDAVVQIDTAFYEARRRHDDSAHSNGVSKNGSTVLNGQAVVNDASAKAIRIPTSPNIIKLGLINSATVKSKGFNPNGIDATANAIQIDVTIGSGITRSLTVTGLQNSQYPSGYSRVSLKGIVDYLNQQFQQTANHFPVTAFDSDDGELVLQHNISDPSCSITIKSPGNSAISTLGFSDIVNIPSSYVDNYVLVVDGYIYSELATLTSGARVQATLSSSVDLGTVTGPTGLDIGANTLFHVFNHTNSSANGTYRIVGTILNTITLNTSLAAGSFSYIIYKDVIDSNFTGNFKTIDLYIDGQRETSSSIRQETTLVQVSGLKIIEVSQDFAATTGSMTLNFSSPTYSVYLTVGGINGETTTFTQGFRGYKKVYAPNNVSYVTIFVFDPSPAVGTDQITFYATEKQDDLLLVGTTHTNAASVIEMPLNKVNVGLSGISSIGSEFLNATIEDDIKNLHINGVIRGLDIIQINGGSLSITLNGGLAYIEGKKISRLRTSIDITKVATSDGNWNLLLSENGNIEIYNDTAAGFSVEEILSTTGYLILAQIVVSGSIVTDYVDGRTFINDIESKLDLIVDDQAFGAGQYRTLESAVLNSRAAANDNKPEIKIISDLIIDNNVTIDADANITAFRDLTINGNLILSSSSVLKVLGALTVTGTITINSNCVLSAGGGTLGAITMSADSSLNITGDTLASSITVTGNNISIFGTIDQPSLTFDGSASGIQLSTPVSNIGISDLELVMTYSTNPIMTINSAGTYNDIVIKNNLFRQSSTFSYPSPTTSRQALYVTSNVTVNRLFIYDNLFRDLSHGIEINNSTFALTDVVIKNNVFTNLYNGIDITTTSGTATDIDIEDNIFNTVFNKCARAVSNTTDSLKDISFNFNYANNNGVVYGLPYLFETNFGCNTTVCMSNISHGLLFSFGCSLLMFSDNLLDGNNASIITTSINGMISNNLVTNTGVTTLSIGSSSAIELLNNIFNTSTTGVIYSFAIGCTLRCIGNKFIDGGTTSSSFTIPNGAIFIDNYIQSGKIFMSGTATPPGRRSITTNNRFIANGLNGTNAIEIIPGVATNEVAIFSNNIIEATGTLNAGTPTLKISATGAGKMIFAGNAIRTTTGRAILGVSATPLQSLLITGNHFLGAASLTRGIEITTSNISCINNIIEGIFTTAEIDVSGTVSNIFISNNSLNGTGAGGKLINIAGTATSTIAKNNKNVVETWVYSALNALQSSAADWTFNISLPTTFETVSATTSGYLVIPLHGIPIGARIENIQVYATTPGSAGTLTLRVFRRPVSSHALTELGSAINNTPSVFQSITTSTLSHNILDDNEYFVVMTSTATNNTIGQVLANIRI